MSALVKLRHDQGLYDDKRQSPGAHGSELLQLRQLLSLPLLDTLLMKLAVDSLRIDRYESVSELFTEGSRVAGVHGRGLGMLLSTEGRIGRDIVHAHAVVLSRLLLL